MDKVASISSWAFLMPQSHYLPPSCGLCRYLRQSHITAYRACRKLTAKRGRSDRVTLDQVVLPVFGTALGAVDAEVMDQQCTT